MPEALQYLAYGAGVVGVIVVSFWGAFRWLLDRIDERFKAAVRSEEFEIFVDKRVAVAFEGALRPLLGALGDVAGKAEVAQKTADAAHRRMDEYLGKDRA